MSINVFDVNHFLNQTFVSILNGCDAPQGDIQLSSDDIAKLHILLKSLCDFYNSQCTLDEFYAAIKEGKIGGQEGSLLAKAIKTFSINKLMAIPEISLDVIELQRVLIDNDDTKTLYEVLMLNQYLLKVQLILQNLQDLETKTKWWRNYKYLIAIGILLLLVGAAIAFTFPLQAIFMVAMLVKPFISAAFSILYLAYSLRDGANYYVINKKFKQDEQVFILSRMPFVFGAQALAFLVPHLVLISFIINFPYYFLEVGKISYFLSETKKNIQLCKKEIDGLEYELALMSNLPKGGPEPGKIYLDDKGNYLIRDDQSNRVYKGNIEGVDLNNLENRLNDPKLKQFILDITSKKGHTLVGLRTQVANGMALQTQLDKKIHELESLECTKIHLEKDWQKTVFIAALYVIGGVINILFPSMFFVPAFLLIAYAIDRIFLHYKDKREKELLNQKQVIPAEVSLAALDIKNKEFIESSIVGSEVVTATCGPKPMEIVAGSHKDEQKVIVPSKLPESKVPEPMAMDLGQQAQHGEDFNLLNTEMVKMFTSTKRSSGNPLATSSSDYVEEELIVDSEQEHVVAVELPPQREEPADSGCPEAGNYMEFYSCVLNLIIPPPRSLSSCGKEENVKDLSPEIIHS